MKYKAAFKICVFGDSGAGKTSIIHRFLTNRFEVDMKLTLGADIATKDMLINNYKIKLQIWDFSGEARYKTLLPAYTLGSSGGIFMYDITKKSSLNNIEEWIKIFKKNLKKEEIRIPIFVVGGKKDLDYYREIPFKHAEKIAQTHSLYDVFECSAKSGENVKNIFEFLTYKMLENINLI